MSMHLHHKQHACMHNMYAVYISVIKLSLTYQQSCFAIVNDIIIASVIAVVYVIISSRSQQQQQQQRQRQPLRLQQRRSQQQHTGIVC